MTYKTWHRKRVVVTCEHIARIQGKIEPGHHMTEVYHGDSYHGELLIDVHHCIQCCLVLPDVIAIQTGLVLESEVVRCEVVVSLEREERRRHCMTCKFCADLAIQAGQDYELIMEAGTFNDEHRRQQA